MWILPQEHRIVRHRYDNVGLEFLPFRWLVQVDDAGAELIMSKPFEDQDIWQPREILASGKVSVATGSYDFRYSLAYHDYQETEVGAKVRFRLPGGLERRQ